MSCADIQDSLVEYLLHELDDTETASVADHLAGGCPDCQAELCRLSESMDMLWQAVPSRPLPEALRCRIMARCIQSPPRPGQTPTEVVITDQPQARRLAAPIWGELLLAFAAGVLLMAGLRIPFSQPLSPERSPIATRAVPPGHDAITSRLGAFNTPDSLEMSEPRFKSTRFVSLHRPTKTSDLNGHLLWDRLSREIHIYCFGLATPPAGTQYTLWLVGPGKSVRILDEMKIDERGECRAVAPWPAGHYQYIQVVLSRRSDMDHLATTDIALTSDALPSNDF